MATCFSYRTQAPLKGATQTGPSNPARSLQILAPRPDAPALSCYAEPRPSNGAYSSSGSPSTSPTKTEGRPSGIRRSHSSSHIAKVLVRDLEYLYSDAAVEDAGKCEEAPAQASAAAAWTDWTPVLQKFTYMLPLALAFAARQPMQACWAFYCTSLDEQPLLTKICTGIICGVAGDLVAQLLAHDSEVKKSCVDSTVKPAFQYDVARAARLCLFSVVLGTPWGHVWFDFLDKNIMPESMTSPAAVLSKMALDQFVSTPITTVIFFIYMRCIEGKPEDAWSYMMKKMKPTLLANWTLWPLAHIINFTFVPPAQRILYCNVVALFWTVILSKITNTPSEPDAPAAAAVQPESPSEIK